VFTFEENYLLLCSEICRGVCRAHEFIVEMSDICVSWDHNRYCYAHEQCRLATRQWSRLLDNMLSVGLVKASPFCGPPIDQCLSRLVNSSDYDLVISRGSGRSDNARTTDCEFVPCEHCCSDEEDGARHGLRRNGLLPWKSDGRIYSPGVKGYRIFNI